MENTSDTLIYSFISARGWGRFFGYDGVVTRIEVNGDSMTFSSSPAVNLTNGSNIVFYSRDFDAANRFKTDFGR